MADYTFDLIQNGADGARQALESRPFIEFGDSFEEGAALFEPGERLTTAINTAIAVGDPLLVTGEPGTGKTQAAYYIAHRLGLGKVLHFQVKSTTKARDLLYSFDTVSYFHDAGVEKKEELDKRSYLRQGKLWQAMATEPPRVLLIDEIDKAPRDFPNDLLHEIDQLEFDVPEVEDMPPVSCAKKLRPIVVITSNNERQLPEPFLRRCVYHHIEFNEDLLREVVKKRRVEFDLHDDFIELATQRFLDIRALNPRKSPSTGEFLVWLRVLALRLGNKPRRLEGDLSKLPYISVLIKNRQDLERLGQSSQNGDG